MTAPRTLLPLIALALAAIAPGPGSFGQGPAPAPGSGGTGILPVERSAPGSSGRGAAADIGNRLTYLDAFADPYYVSHETPKLTTPQWIGEPGVEAAAILAIDDLSDHRRFEAYLRPLIERLKEIDGRAPISLTANRPDIDEPHLQRWLDEGLSIEVHTLTHPCPLLADGDLEAAAGAYHGCVDRIASIPRNDPVAFRMPCFDSINSSSPRFYTELFNQTSPQGRFLTASSSIGMLHTEADPQQPEGYATDPDGRPRFAKYIPAGRNWVNYITNYPYPYIVAGLCWECPSQTPDDWQGFHLQGDGHPKTAEDMRAGLDAAVRAKGLYTATFHSQGWVTTKQMVDLVDHAAETWGPRLRFLTFPEFQRRIDAHLLAGHPIRHPATGRDNGVRILDVNHDGYMDVVIANDEARLTRIWDPDPSKAERWIEMPFPVRIVADAEGPRKAGREMGVRFGVLGPAGRAGFIVRNEADAGLWRFDGDRWVHDDRGLDGLPEDLLTAREGRDRGVRLRDLDGDGLCELLVANESQNAAYQWDVDAHRWRRLPFALPGAGDLAIVTSGGADAGLRFVDLDDDGRDDIVFSNAERYAVHLFGSMTSGWSRPGLSGQRGGRDPADEVPMIVRADGSNNGAWFTRGLMIVQNEDTGNTLPHHIDTRTYEQLTRRSE